MIKIMGSGPKRQIKDIPIIIPKGAGGQGGRPEYGQLKECPDSFRVNLQPSNLTKQLKGGERASLSVVNEKEIRVMMRALPVGRLSENQARKISQCLRLGIKYQGLFHRRGTKRGLRIYAEFRRVV